MLAKIITVLLFQIIPTIPALPSPTPFPTPTEMPLMEATVPRSEIYTFLATAAANVNRMPDQIANAAGPDLPSTDAMQLFSYSKWLFSTNTAQEVLGPTFAPIGINLFIVLTVVVGMAIVWFAILFASMLIKAVVWIVQQILRIIPFIG